ncbi:MAG TPA: S41 family peptidase [Gemmataceae bacterium]
MTARSSRLALCTVLFVVSLALGVAPLRAEQDWTLLAAQQFEKEERWAWACQKYDELLKKDRNSPELKAAYKRCLRHVHQERRLQDESFRTKLIGLKKPSDALDVYEKVLVLLRDNYLERDRVDAVALFLEGLLEFQFGLDDELFRKEYLAGVSDEAIKEFQTRFDPWRDEAAKIHNEMDAREKVQEIALAAMELKLKPTVVIFEFAWGACNALDEYTSCLTPQQWIDLKGTAKGRYVGIGVKLGYNDQKQLVITRVFPDSPAFGELKLFERITHIDGKDVTKLEFRAAAALLQGEEGTPVELKIEPPVGEMATLLGMGGRVIKVQRGKVPIRSVEDPAFLTMPGESMDKPAIGYVRVNSFSDSTVQDLKSAILRLEASGMQVLILDLRGNPGGSFPAGVKVAELFLNEGVIVYKQGRVKEETHKAHNPGAFTMPVVLLVDGETASAAEVVAGALKENNRARIVGQTTFGKGSIQTMIQFDKVPAGMRIKVAHFLSPTNQPYHGQGIAPHRAVELAGFTADTQLLAAQEEARSLASAMPTMNMMR